MNAETRETLREKLRRARRLSLEVTDHNTSESIRVHIEELELRLLSEMGHGPE